MTMFRAGLSVALVIIGAVAAFLGTVVLASALATGTLTLTYGAGLPADVVTRDADPVRFAKLVALLGAAPMLLGVLAARWGWRKLRAG